MTSKRGTQTTLAKLRQAGSFSFPPENFLLGRSNGLFACVFLSLVSSKEGDQGLLSKRRFQDRNVCRRISAVQQFSDLIVFGTVCVHSV